MVCRCFGSTPGKLVEVHQRSVLERDAEGVVHSPAGRAGRGRTASGRFVSSLKRLVQRPGKLAGVASIGLLKTVSVADLQEVITGLIKAAKAGDVSAAKLLFDRLLGPALPLDIEEGLKALEEI